MKVIDNDGSKLTCEISHEEIKMLMGGMREICTGVHIHPDAFNLRVGYKQEQVMVLVLQLRSILDDQGIEE